MTKMNERGKFKIGIPMEIVEATETELNRFADQSSEDANNRRTQTLNQALADGYAGDGVRKNIEAGVYADRFEKIVKYTISIWLPIVYEHAPKKIEALKTELLDMSDFRKDLVTQDIFDRVERACSEHFNFILSDLKLKAFLHKQTTRKKRIHWVLQQLWTVILATTTAYLTVWAESSKTAPAISPTIVTSSDPLPCSLVRVIDGDTIVINLAGIEERVRLLRIDTPERGQPGAKEATRELQRLLSKENLSIEYEKPGKPARDRYGRLLAYVWASDKLVNVEMVKLGHSKFWTKYGEGRYAKRFQ